MMNSRVKQALSYQLSYFGWSSLYVYGIAIAAFVALSIFITTSADATNMQIGIGGVGFFHLLIIGISGIREDLRFFLQHGLTRRTTFFSHLYASVICSIALGLFCEIVNMGARHLFGVNDRSAFIAHNMLPGWGPDAFAYLFIWHAVAFFFAWQLGAFISLIYYRLRKMQQIVFSVTAIAIIVFAFSTGIRSLVGIADELGDTIQDILDNLFGFTSLAIWPVLAAGALAAVGNYLLLRRAQVKG